MLCDEKSKSSNNQVGFITGLLNNNCWGFGELIKLAGKEEEIPANYELLQYSRCPERLFNLVRIDQGMCGTIGNIHI